MKTIKLPKAPLISLSSLHDRLPNSSHNILYKQPAILTQPIHPKLPYLLLVYWLSTSSILICSINSPLIMAKNVAQSPLEINSLASLDQKLAMAKRCSHGNFCFPFLCSSLALAFLFFFYFSSSKT
jgi:hypothetical protein